MRCHCTRNTSNEYKRIFENDVVLDLQKKKKNTIRVSRCEMKKTYTVL